MIPHKRQRPAFYRTRPGLRSIGVRLPASAARRVPHMNGGNAASPPSGERDPCDPGRILLRRWLHRYCSEQSAIARSTHRLINRLWASPLAAGNRHIGAPSVGPTRATSGKATARSPTTGPAPATTARNADAGNRHENEDGPWCISHKRQRAAFYRLPDAACSPAGLSL